MSNITENSYSCVNEQQMQQCKECYSAHINELPVNKLETSRC